LKQFLQLASLTEELFFIFWITFALLTLVILSDKSLMDFIIVITQKTIDHQNQVLFNLSEMMGPCFENSKRIPSHFWECMKDY